MYIIFVVIAILLALAGIAWLGFSYADARLEDDWGKLNSERQLLDVERTTLEQTRKVNDVFFRARDAMRQAEDEAGGFGTRRPPRSW